MRTSDELLTDLSTMDSMQWNTALALEYGMDYNSFMLKMNTYMYIATSEDAIHHRLTLIYDDPSENGIENETILVPDITTRKINDLVMYEGEVIDNVIFSDFSCENSSLIGVLITGSLFRNCIFTGSILQNMRIINSKFIDCDFSKCDLSGTVIAKSQFYECVFNNSKMGQMTLSDVIIHTSQFINVDMDDSHIITTNMHDCNMDNSSLKRLHLLGGILSYITFNNSNLTDSSLIDMNLIYINAATATMEDIVVCSTMSTSIIINEMYVELFNSFQDEDEIEDNLYNSDDIEGDDEQPI